MDRTSENPGSGPPAGGAPDGSGGKRGVPGYRIVDEKPAAEKSAEQKSRSIARRRRLVERAYQGLDYVFFVLYGLLGIRLALGLLAASEQAGFVVFVQAITEPFYGPFVDIVPSVALTRGTFELSIVIALLAYLLLHVALRGLLHVLLGTKRSI